MLFFVVHGIILSSACRNLHLRTVFPPSRLLPSNTAGSCNWQNTLLPKLNCDRNPTHLDFLVFASWCNFIMKSSRSKLIIKPLLTFLFLANQEINYLSTLFLGKLLSDLFVLQLSLQPSTFPTADTHRAFLGHGDNKPSSAHMHDLFFSTLFTCSILTNVCRANKPR